MFFFVSKIEKKFFFLEFSMMQKIPKAVSERSILWLNEIIVFFNKFLGVSYLDFSD